MRPGGWIPERTEATRTKLFGRIPERTDATRTSPVGQIPEGRGTSRLVGFPQGQTPAGRLNGYPQGQTSGRSDGTTTGRTHRHGLEVTGVSYAFWCGNDKEKKKKNEKRVKKGRGQRCQEEIEGGKGSEKKRTVKKK